MRISFRTFLDRLGSTQVEPGLFVVPWLRMGAWWKPSTKLAQANSQ